MPFVVIIRFVDIVVFEFRSWRDVLDTTLCDNLSRLLATGLWFSPGIPVFCTNKTDHHDITELLKVALNTIARSQPLKCTGIIPCLYLPIILQKWLMIFT